MQRVAAQEGEAKAAKEAQEVSNAEVNPDLLQKIDAAKFKMFGVQAAKAALESNTSESLRRDLTEL